MLLRQIGIYPVPADMDRRNADGVLKPTYTRILPAPISNVFLMGKLTDISSTDSRKTDLGGLRQLG